MAELVQLAQRFVDLTAEIETVRSQMVLSLNGSDPNPDPPHPRGQAKNGRRATREAAKPAKAADKHR
jgi:hypothetical protein